MAEEIVACPGCAKKFRIPEGADSGSFPCTACGVDVPYGAAARKPAPKAAARAATAQARPVAARPVAAAPARPAPARPAPASRRASAVAEPRGHRTARGGVADAPKKGNQALIWVGVVAGIGVIGLVYVMTKPKELPPAPVTPAATAGKTTEPPKPTEQPKPVPPPKPTETKPVDPVPSPPKPETKGPDVKIPMPELKPDEPPKPMTRADYSTLGQPVKSVEGMSDAERGDMDKMVALAVDFQSGKEGADAESKIVRSGKKAIPSILSHFSKQYTAAKWSSNDDQYAGDKLLDLLHRIAGADGVNPATDVWPRFMSGSPSEDFEKGAKNWFDWWNTRGRTKDKYKAREDK